MKDYTIATLWGKSVRGLGRNWEELGDGIPDPMALYYKIKNKRKRKNNVSEYICRSL